MIPLLVGTFYVGNEVLDLHEKNIFATLVFLVAALTDWLDGFLARILGQTSKFGAFLDPVADKLMVTAALILLVYLDRVGLFIAMIIIGREIAVSALREWMAILGETKSVAVSLLGKIKTVVQMLAILMLLYKDPIFGLPTFELGTWLVYAATILTLWSMFYYLKRALPLIKNG